MTRTSKSVVQLGAALTLSLVAGLAIFQWLTGLRRIPAPAAPVVQTVQMVQAVVAARNLPRGTRIEPDMLKSVSFVPESLPPQSFTDAQALAGRVLTASLARGEVLTESRLAPSEVRSGGVSAIVGPGRRAMAVKGNKVMGLSGFIRPGNRVDVLVSLDLPEEAGRSMAKLVLANVPVLAAGNELEYDGKSDKPSSVEIYTLEVSPEESEILALAATKGTLHFALRGGADEAPALTEGADVPRTLASNRPTAAPPPREAASPRPARETAMQIITGAKSGTVRFQEKP